MPTVEQAVKDYLAAERARNAKTKSNAEEAQRDSRATEELRRFVYAIGAEKTVGQLSVPDVADYGAGEVRKGGDFEARLRPVKEFLAHLKKNGWHKDSLSVHVKIPRPAVPKGEKRTAAGGIQTVMMTESGLEARKKELESLEAEIGRGVQSEAYGSGREPLVAAAHKASLKDRIRELKEEIRDAEVVETTVDSSADLGARIKLRSLDDETTREYRLVGPFEANPADRKLSIKSPVGEAVVGKRKRNQITVKTPSGGERRYRIDKVAF